MKPTYEELLAQVDTLRAYLLEASQHIGFLSNHLRGRMAKGAIIGMAKNSEKWQAIAQSDAAACLAQVKAGVLREAVELYTHKWQTEPALVNVDIEIIKKGAGFIYPAGLLQFAEDIESGIEQQGGTE